MSDELFVDLIDGTVPIGLRASVAADGSVRIGNYEVSPQDFLRMVEYVTTHSAFRAATKQTSKRTRRLTEDG